MLYSGVGSIRAQWCTWKAEWFLGSNLVAFLIYKVVQVWWECTLQILYLENQAVVTYILTYKLQIINSDDASCAVQCYVATRNQ